MPCDSTYTWNLKNNEQTNEQMFKKKKKGKEKQIKWIDTENKLVVTREQIGGGMSEIAEGDSMYKIPITKWVIQWNI